MIIRELFFTSFKIGLFTFGGGYAMIPMIQDEIVTRGWMSMTQLVDFIAISESTPGPFAVNIATFVGESVSGFSGAFAATFGVILPSFIVILLVAKYFMTFKDNFYVKSVLSGLRPTIIGLIAAAAFSIFTANLFTAGREYHRLDFNMLIICAAMFGCAFLVKRKLHPIVLILISAVLGIMFYKLFPVFV